MATRLSLQFGPSRKILIWLFALAMAAQLGIAMVIDKPWMTADSDFYVRLAGSIDQGFYGWPRDGAIQPDALRPPGYPVILWLLLFRLHFTLLLVVALQMVLYLASVVLIALRLEREGVDWVPFQLLALIYPFGAIYCGYVMTEAWATIALTGVALLASSQRLTTARLAGSGLIAGLATLFRGDLLLLPLIIAVIALGRDWASVPMPRKAMRALVPVLAAAAVLTPYTLWNNHHFGRLSPIPVASAVGNSLYLATWQGKVPLDDLNALYSRRITPRVEAAGLASEIHQLNTSLGADPLTPPFNPAAYPTNQQQRQSSAVFLEAAQARIVADPGSYARHVARNFWALWNTSNYPGAIPAVGRWGLALISGLVCLAGLVGLLLALQSRRPIAAAGLVLLYPMIIHLPLHTEARYTAPVRPLLLMFASVAVLWLLKCYRNGQWQFSRKALG